jgi:hypothetical protein
MKNIILTLFLLLSCFSFGQIAPPKRKITLNLPLPNSQSNVRPGPFMVLGGAAFIVGGLLTPPLMVGGSTIEKQPFYKQGGRALAIISGSLTLTIGIGVTLSGN